MCFVTKLNFYIRFKGTWARKHVRHVGHVYKQGMWTRKARRPRGHVRHVGT